MKARDLAEWLLAKAAQDEALLDRVLADNEIADDIGELIDLLDDAQLRVPAELREIDGLTPFAVEARYDFLPPSAAQFDRSGARQMVRALRAWVEESVRSMLGE